MVLLDNQIMKSRKNPKDESMIGILCGAGHHSKKKGKGNAPLKKSMLEYLQSKYREN